MQKTSLIGVCLVNDLKKSSNTSLGVCVVSRDALSQTSVQQLRQLICQQIVACPPQFTICTKEGWIISDAQESFIYVPQILSNNNTILIQVKHDLPKIGVRDSNGCVLGFVLTSYTSHLAELRVQLQRQVLVSGRFSSSSVQFLDSNLWPVSVAQEKVLMVSDIMVDSCVSTDICIKRKPSVEFSPPETPRHKRLRAGCRQLSFRSSKDVTRQLSTGSSNSPEKLAKQVLISYVRAEAAKHALALKEELSALGFSIYLDVHEIQSGVDWQDSLNFAVSGCEVFVPLVTPLYGETQWTNREVKLADVLGKYILPVSFLSEWPPRCLAIQFATTQFIPWIPHGKVKDLSDNFKTEPNLQDWSKDDIRAVAIRISDRLKGLSLASTPSLIKRATIVKSCACLKEDNSIAILSDREGKPLVMICLHPDQASFGEEVSGWLEADGYEVWCTTELNREHMDEIDGLARSQDGASFCVVSNSIGNKDLEFIREFQEKADDSSVVLFVLSQAFSVSRTCQQQVFYCEHRKRVIPILYEDLQMPRWMSMLIGSQGFERRTDEDFQEILMQRVKSQINTEEMFSPSTASINSDAHLSPLQGAMNGRLDPGSSPHQNGESPNTHTKLASQETVLLQNV